MASITLEARQSLVALYVGMFNAAPGADNLSTMVQSYEAGKSLKQIATELDNAAFRTQYPAFLTADEFADRLVSRLLGSEVGAAQTAWATNWVKNKLNSGVSDTDLLVEAVNALRATDNTAYDNAQASLSNKVTVAEYYSITKAQSSTSLSDLQSVISGVTSDTTTVDTAKTTVDNTVAAAVAKSFTLTSGADTGSTFTGGDGNDTYVAQINADLGTGTTFNAGDSLDGKAGTDTLNITVAGASTAAVTSTATTLANIEKVLVSNFDSNTDDAEDNEFNGALWTGVTNVGLSSSSGTGDTKFSNLTNIVAAEMSNGSADLEVDYGASVVVGTADSQSLSLTSVSSATFTADSGIETIAVTTNGTSNTLTSLAGSGAKTLTVAGEGTFTVTNALPTNITTIDASATSGKVSLVLGTANHTVTGSAGADTIRLDGAQVNTSDSINGGEGADTLLLTGAVSSALNGAKLASFESVLSYQDVAAANAFTQDVSFIADATTVGVNKMTYTDDEDDTDDDVTVSATFNNMSATQVGVISGVSTATSDNNSTNDKGDLTANVTFDLKSDTTADTGTITLGSAVAAATSAATDQTITLNVTASDYETLTLVSQGGSNTIGTLTASDATSLTVNASKALTITTLTAGAVKTIDASASTAAVSIGATSIASTITGGAGNDTFTGSGSADSITAGAGDDTLSGGGGADTIYGGAGNDSITGGAGNDKIYGEDGDDIITDAATGSVYIEGGAGNDTFTVATYSDLTSADTIIGGDGTDTLAISENGNLNLTTDITQLSNVSGIERISFTGLAGGDDTVTINDGVVSTTGGSLTLYNASNSATTWNASGVLASASTVNYSQASTVTAAQTFSIGNGKDVVTLGSGGDTVTVTNNAYLSSSDTIDAGTGSDTLNFTHTTGSSITAAQLTNVTNFETFQVNTGGAGNYTFTLDDTIVGAQVAIGGTFTVSRADGDTNTATLKVDGSAVTSNYALTLTADTTATSATTLIGGAGNDTLNTGLGADSLTGGAGNDTFKLLGNGKGYKINDFDAGTSLTTVDKISLTVADVDADNTATLQTGANFAQTVVWSSGAITASVINTTDLAIFTTTGYTDASAVETAVEALDSAVVTQDFLIVYQDTLGQIRLALAESDGATDSGNDFVVNDLAILGGVTLSGLQAALNTSDFTVA